jgi:predicted DNA-binding transcriptional regulator AlpA
VPYPKTIASRTGASAIDSPRTFHVDKRADAILAATSGDDDELLSTPAVARWLGVSTVWLEIRRSRGGGPPFARVSPRIVRYRRGEVRAWLAQRRHLSSSEYRAQAEA